MKQGMLSQKEFNRKVKYAFESKEMLDVLTKDMDKINEIMRIPSNVKYESDLQSWMRIMVRTTIDSIDALIYRVRELSRDLIKLRGDEKKLLPRLKKENLRYAFKVCAIAFDSTFEIKEGDEKLKDYLEVRKIRNRITHPQKLTDLDISLEKEYVKFADTYHWFSDCIKQLNKQSKWTRKYPQVKILY